MANIVVEDEGTNTADMGAEAPVAEQPLTADEKKRVDLWQSRIAACQRVKRQLIPDWEENVDYRRGKPFPDDSDNDRIQVTIDWTATKAKQAQLFSQVPEIRLTANAKPYAASAPMFAKKVNNELCAARVGVAMDEALPDNINAAGIGVVLVGFESLSTQKDMLPTGVNQDMADALKAKGTPVKMEQVPLATDKRFRVSRLSPADLLWDVGFAGSDFDDSGWIGNDGRCTGEESMQMLGLTADQVRQATKGDARKTQDRISSGSDQLTTREADVVNYSQIFYWKHRYDKGAVNYHEIQHLVFVKGLTRPVVDGPWKGQKLLPQQDGSQRLVGARKLPIRVLTLTYITDECIPPSDSAMGRPTVNELNRSRSQMIRNREASVPLRWFNVNLVDPQIQTSLLRGTWQGFIPMNGRGDNAIGEIARASYPPEDNTFDNIAKQDLRNTWQVEDAFNDGPQIRSATEAHNRQQNFQTRIGYERARVGKFFVGVAEVLAGLVALYGDFSEEELQALGGLPKEMLSDYYAFNIRADSSLLLDAEQRIERLMKYIDMTAKSGYVNVKPVITEITELMGLDPSEVMQDPQEPKPEPVRISMTLKGAEDLDNVTVIAMLLHNQQLPSPEEMNAAKKFLATLAVQPVAQGAPVPGVEGPPPGQQPLPPGGPGAPPAGGPPAGGPPPAPAGGREVATKAPAYEAHKQWQTAPHIDKRQKDGK